MLVSEYAAFSDIACDVQNAHETGWEAPNTATDMQKQQWCWHGLLCRKNCTISLGQQRSNYNAAG